MTPDLEHNTMHFKKTLSTFLLCFEGVLKISLTIFQLVSSYHSTYMNPIFSFFKNKLEEAHRLRENIRPVCFLLASFSSLISAVICLLVMHSNFPQTKDKLFSSATEVEEIHGTKVCSSLRIPLSPLQRVTPHQQWQQFQWSCK